MSTHPPTHLLQITLEIKKVPAQINSAIDSALDAASDAAATQIAVAVADVAGNMGKLAETLEAAVAAAAGKVQGNVESNGALDEKRYTSLVADVAEIKKNAEEQAKAKAEDDAKVVVNVEELAGTVKTLAASTAAITNALYGSIPGLPASSCSAIKKKRAGAADGTNYYLKKGDEVYNAQCITNSKNQFVSVGGNGKTQASASAGCFGANSLLAANSDATKWIDPDDDAENTDNAKKQSCIVSLVPWENDNCNPPAGTGAFASDYRAQQLPCKAFDDNDDPDSQKDGGDFWQTNGKSQQGAFIGWNFGTKVKVKVKEFLVDNNYTPRVFHSIVLEGSNDGSAWEAIMYTGNIGWKPNVHDEAKTFQVGDAWKQKKAFHQIRIFNYAYDSSGSHALIGKLKFVGSFESA